MQRHAQHAAGVATERVERMLSDIIRDVPDFPKPGILFKDITTLLKEPRGLRDSIDALYECCKLMEPDVIVGIESRGFMFGAPVAYRLGTGFVPVRKEGKLPAPSVRAEYALEYGTNTVEIHRDAIIPGQRAVIVDDLLATGGTCGASIRLVEELGGVIVGAAFLVELTFLHGRKALEGYRVETIIQY